MSIARSVAIQEFIREYIAENTGTDVTDAEFHEEFTKRFGGKQILKNYGACPNRTAMMWLKRLYARNILNRDRVGLYGHESGFPKWVWCYTLKKYAAPAPARDGGE